MNNKQTIMNKNNQNIMKQSNENEKIEHFVIIVKKFVIALLIN